MTLQDLIDDLERAKRHLGPHAPVGIRHTKDAGSHPAANYPVRVTKPVIVRSEGGNVYLDPES